jgi:RNA polymerase sigma-70 factor (ECF subfamily)
MSGTAEDVALLQAWRDGDRSAGTTLFARHFMSVYRFFVNKLPALADELSQRTFTVCVEARDRMAPDSNVRAYLLGIARRQLIMHFRSVRSCESLGEDGITIADVVASPSEAAVAEEEHALLARALRRLPLDLQTTLELFYWEELALDEIATILDVPVGTVKSRLFRGRELLREKIERLDAPLALRHSTIEGLDTWARRLRDRLAADP